MCSAKIAKIESRTWQKQYETDFIYETIPEQRKKEKQINDLRASTHRFFFIAVEISDVQRDNEWIKQRH